MVFIIRMQTSQGIKRLRFPDDSAKWEALQAEVADLYNIKPGKQRISKDKGADAKVIDAPGSTALTSLGLKHGSILYLQKTDNQAISSSLLCRPTSASTARTFRLTAKCKHGPRGRCLECVPDEDPSDVQKQLNLNRGKLTKLCIHGPGVTCMHCSVHVGDVKADPALWLCNHPDSVFCPNCIPPEEEDEDEKKEESSVKAQKIPYRQFMKERRALCQFKHPPHVSCMACAEPVFPSYAGKKNCNKGHKPWPYGVCLSCAPANAILRVQPYRHCDVASVPAQLVQKFYGQWMRGDPFTQKAAIMFGTYVDEPDTTGVTGAVRAQIQCLYEPPQEGLKDYKGVRFLKDPNEKLVHEVASWLGIAPVGWIVTSPTRKGGEKYKGDIIMSAPEVQIAAKLQYRYKNDKSHSRFMTVLVEHGDQVKPAAYQVSDQCVAMQRDGLFGKAKDPFMMTIRSPEKGEMMSTVITGDRPLKPGKEFLPDEFIVKTIFSTPKVATNMFKHDDFPSRGNDGSLKFHLNQCASEPYESKLSDFNLLCYLATKNKRLIKEVCTSLRKRQSFDQKSREELDTMTIPFTYG